MLSKLQFLKIGLVIVTLFPAVGWAQTKASEPEDEPLVVISKTEDKDFPARFDDKLFMISINRSVAGAEKIMNALVRHLTDTGRLNDFLLRPFGPRESQGVEIGSRVPVDVAQLVIRLLSEENVPFSVSVNKDDAYTRNLQPLFFGFTQRIIIGSIRKKKRKSLSKDTIAALLKVGITQKEFVRIISESK